MCSRYLLLLHFSSFHIVLPKKRLPTRQYTYLYNYFIQFIHILHSMLVDILLFHSTELDTYMYIIFITCFFFFLGGKKITFLHSLFFSLCISKYFLLNHTGRNVGWYAWTFTIDLTDPFANVQKNSLGVLFFFERKYENQVNTVI